MDKEERTLKSRTVYDGKILKLCVDDVSLPGGGRSVRECVRHSGGACVLFIREGKVALVKQFRYLYGREIYEIPAGKMNDGEDARASALRELEEETGWRAGECEHLLDIYPSPGYTDEVIHIFLVTKACFAGQKLDEGEFLDCEYLPLERVVSMIERGEICDAKTVAAVYKYLSTKKGA